MVAAGIAGFVLFPIVYALIRVWAGWLVRGRADERAGRVPFLVDERPRAEVASGDVTHAFELGELARRGCICAGGTRASFGCPVHDPIHEPRR
jgi:hypothetical protein